MELLYTSILSENKTNQDFNLDLFNILKTAHNPVFLATIEKI